MLAPQTYTFLLNTKLAVEKDDLNILSRRITGCRHSTELKLET